jgi:hypothetical protein
MEKGTRTKKKKEQGQRKNEKRNRGTTKSQMTLSVPGMYPPPHMTCIYPPPHMTCMYPQSSLTLHSALLPFVCFRYASSYDYRMCSLCVRHLLCIVLYCPLCVSGTPRGKIENTCPPASGTWRAVRPWTKSAGGPL